MKAAVITGKGAKTIQKLRHLDEHQGWVLAFLRYADSFSPDACNRMTSACVDFVKALHARGVPQSCDRRQHG